MKILNYIFIFVLIGSVHASLYAQDCIFISCIKCPNDCDNREQFETCEDQLYGKTFFSFRPQDSDSSRRILGWFNADYKSSLFQKKIRNVFMISPQYTRSFDRKKLARWFFFNGNESMTVGIPSDYESFDINGSQIGLSLGDEGYEEGSLIPGKIGKVWARPWVENFILDFDYWHDLSSITRGLWMRFEAPLVYTKTNMNLCSLGRGVQDEPYPMGLMTLNGVDTEYCDTTPVPYKSILCALQGDEGWGAIAPLKSGKFPIDAQSKWGVAGLHVDLGYDILRFEPWYAAASLHVVFPTGSRPKGTYVFEPVIGANKSWQFGATLITNYVKELKNNRQIGAYLYAVGTHLFGAKQDRVYGLKNNGAGSQLLLLKQFNAVGGALIDAEREANIFCGSAKIGSTLMFDGSCMMQYSQGNLVADLGYNFWARTKEKRSKAVCFRGFQENGFGIKGDLPMEDHIVEPGCLNTIFEMCIYNLDTAHCATIACPCEADTTKTFIQPCDIEYGSALQPTAMSHKIFGAVGFKSSWFALLSGEVEFGNNAALNQWGIMIKIGKDF